MATSTREITLRGARFSRLSIDGLRKRAALWRERRRTRRALARLDPRMLEDVGLTQDEAQAEAAKPFWRA